MATYGEKPQRLDGLRQINFLFGTNGKGKDLRLSVWLFFERILPQSSGRVPCRRHGHDRLSCARRTSLGGELFLQRARLVGKGEIVEA